MRKASKNTVWGWAKNRVSGKDPGREQRARQPNGHKLGKKKGLGQLNFPSRGKGTQSPTNR